MKTGLEKRQADQKKLFRKVIKTLAIDKAIRLHGEKDVKWAITKYLSGVRERTKLLKEKAAAESKMAEISRKLGI
jgi:hypothetical protein